MLPPRIFDQHNHIWLDLDETLASTIPGLLDHSHRQWKLLSISDFEAITSYDFSDIDPNISREEARNAWESYGKSTMDPVLVPNLPYTKEGVLQLIEKWKKISIVTARSDREAWKVERTKKWIETYFPEIWSDNITFVNHFSEGSLPKSHACKNAGITLHIDDSLEVAYDLSSAWIYCILLDKPWNRNTDFNHPLVHRVADWKEIIDNLEIYV